MCFLFSPAPWCRNVEDVCRFPDLPARRQLTYQAKQLIAREIELEKMRRTEALLQARNLSEVGRVHSVLSFWGGGGSIDGDKVLGAGVGNWCFQSRRWLSLCKWQSRINPPESQLSAGTSAFGQHIRAGATGPKGSSLCRNSGKKSSLS